MRIRMKMLIKIIKMLIMNIKMRMKHVICES